MESSETDENIIPSRGRKRKRNPASWKQSLRKLKSARGEKFMINRGELIPSRKIRPTSSCRAKCFKKIGEITIKKCFADFDNLSDKKLQESHLFGLMDKSLVNESVVEQIKEGLITEN